MEKIKFIVEDAKHLYLESIEEETDIETTTQELIKSVTAHLILYKRPEVFVKYRLNGKNVGVSILKHSVAVDDAYMTFQEYVTSQCKIIVTSMFRTRESVE
jgi:hypothetical protein